MSNQETAAAIHVDAGHLELCIVGAELAFLMMPENVIFLGNSDLRNS
jgi:hypothetical protein